MFEFEQNQFEMVKKFLIEDSLFEIVTETPTIVVGTVGLADGYMIVTATDEGDCFSSDICVASEEDGYRFLRFEGETASELFEQIYVLDQEMRNPEEV